MEEYMLKGKLMLSGKIKCLTGLHIGSSSEEMEIGGNDNPVIRNPINGEPYIPGSTLKGKLRSLTEWSLGLIEPHKDHKGEYVAYECKELAGKEKDSPKYKNAYLLARLYGPATNSSTVKEVAGPSRLLVRDAFLTPEAKKLLEQNLGIGLFTEMKTENTLDRVTSEANPRPIERVPASVSAEVSADVSFTFNIILDMYQQSDFELLRDLFAAMHLLENSSLGGMGSRGYGQVEFKEIKLSWRSVKYYTGEEEELNINIPYNSLAEIIKKFGELKNPITG